jgi:signal peptidase II
MKKSLLFIPLLVAVDQGIKLIVANFFLEPRVFIPIINGVFYFSPVQNIHRGWIPSMLGYMMPVALSVSLTVGVTPLMIVVYRFLSYTIWCYDLKCKKAPAVILTVMLAIVVCRLIDDIFWGGAIDSVQMFNWFVFDLADVYSTFVQILLLYVIVVFYVQYVKLTKEERKGLNEKHKLIHWIKSGLPTKPV